MWAQETSLSQSQAERGKEEAQAVLGWDGFSPKVVSREEFRPVLGNPVVGCDGSGQKQQTSSRNKRPFKSLFCSTGNYIQYPEMNHNGKEAFKKESIYMYNGITFLYSRNQQNLVNQ